MKKLLAITLTLALMLSLFALSSSAAGLRGQDGPAAQYTSVPPEGSSAYDVILYQNFDNCASPESVGFFATTQEKETETTYYEYPDCEIALSSEHAHSGTKSLKVYHRDLVDNSTKGHHTFIYKGTNDSNSIGALIASHYSGAAPQTDTYFFRAWVYSDTAQTFLFQMQYGGTLEFWTPNDEYYYVPAKTWTLIGGYVQDGVTYYSSMLEDFAGAGVYPPRAASTWTGLKATTRNEQQVNTWGDFYVDDIALWKVNDSSKLFNFNKQTNQIEDLNGKRPSGASGDANGDGDLDMKDVLLIRKVIAGMGGVLQVDAADVDRDGAVTMKDVLLIRKFIAGLIRSFDDPTPVTPPTKKTTTTKRTTTTTKRTTTTTKRTTTTSKRTTTTTRPVDPTTLIVPKIAEKTLKANPAVIKKYTGRFDTTGAKHTYDYTPTVSERFSLFLTDMPEGMVQNIRIYNLAGDLVAGSRWDHITYGNDETVSADLTAGQKYRFEITSHYACSYTLNVAYKNTPDVSAYTAITDSMEYANQKNTYRFTPKETGYYCVYLDGMPDGMEQLIRIYNPAGDLVAGSRWDHNTYGNDRPVSATLTAGQTYRFEITQKYTCSYTLHVVHKDKENVSGYKNVKDSMEHPGQHNTYLYTPSVTAKVSMYLGDMPEGMHQYIQIYNPAGKMIAGYDDHPYSNGKTVSADLTAGQTYTIVVSAYDICDYTLNIG